MSFVRPYKQVDPHPKGAKVRKKLVRTINYLSVGSFSQQIDSDKTQEIPTDYYYEPYYAKKIKYGTKDIEV